MEQAALHAILSRSFFRRRWIIQELVVTQAKGRTPYIYLGAYGWDWPFLVDMAEHQLPPSPERDRFLVLPSRARDDNLANTTLVTKVKAAVSGTGRRRNLSSKVLSTLHVFDYAECSDPRDRLYALFNICYGLKDFPIDYTKDVETLYLDFALAIASPQPDPFRDFLLELLAMASCRRTVNDLPLWVPDWRSKIQCTSDEHREAVESCARGKDMGTIGNRAEAGVAAIREAGRALALRGWLLRSGFYRLRGPLRKECGLCALRDPQLCFYCSECKGECRSADRALQEADDRLEDHEAMVLLPGSDLAFVASINREIGTENAKSALPARLISCFQPSLQAHKTESYLRHAFGEDSKEWIVLR